MFLLLASRILGRKERLAWRVDGRGLLFPQRGEMGVGGFHDVPGEDGALEAVGSDVLQRLGDVFRGGEGDAGTVIDLDTGVFVAGVGGHRIELGIKEFRTHLKYGIPGRAGQRRLQ